MSPAGSPFALARQLTNRKFSQGRYRIPSSSRSSLLILPLAGSL
jgi:hypothetical protein